MDVVATFERVVTTTDAEQPAGRDASAADKLSAFAGRTV